MDMQRTTNKAEKTEQTQFNTTGTRLLKLKKVVELTTISRSRIYALIKSKQFPKPIKLSKRSIAFVASDIDDWICKRVAEARLSSCTD